jgi:alpha-glucosidase (family GH31 glycosyl hydrolase)
MIGNNIITLCLFVALLSTLLNLSYGDNNCAVSDSDKIDCGFAGIDQNGCESNGCCWSPAGENSDTPWCYNQAATPSLGYELNSLTETLYGYEGSLSLIGKGTSTYGADIPNLKLQVYFESEDIFHMKITDSNKERYEIPHSIIPRSVTKIKPLSMNYKFSFTSSPFTFKVTRNSDGVDVFSNDSPIIFKDQYIELSTTIKSNAKTYGIGESTRLNQALNNGVYTLWAADIPAAVFDVNLYGSFPYYVQMVDGSAHGAMLLNSNGMDIVLDSTQLTYKTIGGIIDLYVFAGSTPGSVVSQYTSIVGRPTMMPYWSLGFHNCKYGYTDLQQVEDVVDGYASAGIPLDTQWMDIDYMQNFKDFTTDSSNFPTTQVKEFVDDLHNKGQSFVPIIDPGIYIQNGYEAYDRGISEGLFVKDLSGGYYLGQVWPGPTYFPDFINPNTQSYWTDSIKSFWDMVGNDGLWIDMNEVSNFCNNDGKGQVCKNDAPSGCPAPGASQTDCCLSCSEVDSTNPYDFPPYSIHNHLGPLSQKTMAVSSTHYNNISDYNIHNLYGLTEQIATNEALAVIRQKRPFLLTRSSFVSTGKHSAKWTGDNEATWDNLKSSIVSILDFNLFGIPMIGADICGFIGDTTEELCARWIEVGSFYPFSRNHNALGQANQELYLWDTVTNAAKNALSMRYQLLPFFYTLFYNSHINGDMVVRSLWVNYPTDANTLDINDQFMIGNGILVSPVVDQGSTSVNAYFPQGVWYNFAERSFAYDTSSGGATETISTPLTSINVHVRGGVVLPLQDAAMTTTAGRKTPFTFLAALCSQGQAYGDLYWDNGEQIDLVNYASISFHVQANGSSGSFTSTVNHNNYISSDEGSVQTVVILGTSTFKGPTSATLNGTPLCSSQISFDSTKNQLMFSNLNLHLVDAIEIQWL